MELFAKIQERHLWEKEHEIEEAIKVNGQQRDNPF